MISNDCYIVCGKRQTAIWDHHSATDTGLVVRKSVFKIFNHVGLNNAAIRPTQLQRLARQSFS